MANVRPIAGDLLQGNLLLHGWHMSDVSFYPTELVQDALAAALLAAALLAADRPGPSRRWRVPPLAPLLLAWVLVADPVVEITGVGPLAAAGLGFAWQLARRRPDWYCAAVSVRPPARTWSTVSPSWSGTGTGGRASAGI